MMQGTSESIVESITFAVSYDTLPFRLALGAFCILGAGQLA